ncbi:helix-turn-helix domain-containing protein [bacterium]|nr:helix-turn-helix domain-containing protein [bacterium]
MGRRIRTKLRDAREKLLLSQREAGELIGVHALTIARWETGQGGRISNSRSNIRAYCKALAQYAAALGYEAEDYRTHLLCPGEFPDPALVTADGAW